MSKDLTEDELFHAGQVRAIVRAIDAVNATSAKRRVNYEVAVALGTPGAPEEWIAGMQHIEALLNEAFPS